MRIKKVSKKKLIHAIKELNLKNAEREQSTCLDRVEDGERPEGFIAYVEGELAGWGCYFEESGECHIIIHPNFRRQGIGKKLIKRLTKWFPDGMYCPWDERSRKFYESSDSKIHPDFKCKN